MSVEELFTWIKANQDKKYFIQEQVDAIDYWLLSMTPEDIQDILSKLNGWVINKSEVKREYNLTEYTLSKIFTDANKDVVPLILKHAPAYGIITKKQMAAFIATCIIESNGFNAVRESFNYRPERLLEVFPKFRIPNLAFAKKLVAEGQPAIANHLYNGRMGNRIGSNDGWDYRGNSWIQLTGRDNHYEAQQLTGLPVGDNPKLLEDLETACIVTMNWWKLNGLNEKAEKINTYSDGYTLNTLNSRGQETKDYMMNTGARLIRRTVNGGYNDYTKFCKYLEKSLQWL